MFLFLSFVVSVLTQLHALAEAESRLRERQASFNAAQAEYQSLASAMKEHEK